jgi:hypothetical protein
MNIDQTISDIKTAGNFHEVTVEPHEHGTAFRATAIVAGKTYTSRAAIVSNSLVDEPTFPLTDYVVSRVQADINRMAAA